MSDSAVVRVEIPPAALAAMAGYGDEMMQAIKRGMDYSLSIVRGRIQNERLSGKGPYPPEEHRLGIVTQQLQGSLREEPAVITGTTVTGAIGSPVFYGALHEYGWSGTVRGRGKNPKPYAMTIPVRAPVTTGVEENAAFISDEINKEVDRSLAQIAAKMAAAE